MRQHEREFRKRIRKERRSDEDYLYYVLERDLDRGAILRDNDGWSDQVSMGKGKRIDYVVKYRDCIYGIEVKKGFPSVRDFEQAKKYLGFLNGVFLAYPSDRAGEAPSTSERKQDYIDIGLISISLFRSHVIRKARFFNREKESLWYQFDEKKYCQETKESGWEQYDRLAATVLKDGCFWVTFNNKGEGNKEPCRLLLNKSDWTGLALLYGVSKAYSIFKYFSVSQLNEREKELKWNDSFNLGRLVQADLADERSFGNRAYMFSLSAHAVFLENQLVKNLKAKLEDNRWNELTSSIVVWKQRHQDFQKEAEKNFIEK